MTQDGIDFLLDQHQQVEKLLDQVKNSVGEARQASFDELRQLLATHEAAEELILRPVTRRSVEGGDEIADARIAEENQAKDVLSQLEKLDVASVEFTTTFETFAADVQKHAHNEETYEFPSIRASQDSEDLARLETALATAEKVAPTHPHPSARSTTATAVLGPFAALLDKARDAIGKATSD
ncbi:MAG TPA: hemerythrin domain-containing protein [Mycobacteriales bacterium]|nr:hemerythrin domain-containing protein [Mycobacteriales bacterium]